MSTLIVLPTGCGKTICFADVIRQRSPGRALVIAHREELIFQAQEKIARVTGFDVQIEMGAYHADTAGLMGAPPVVVSTVQTLTMGGDGGGRLGKFAPGDFSTLIVDEGHHAPAKGYRRVIDYFRQNPELRVLGVTATPDRADEEALGQVFESVAADYEILNAIEDGWLVPVEQQMVDVAGLDFSTVRTTAGELNGADLAAVMEYEKNLHGIADPTVKIVGDRRALVFASSVAHAERLAEIFNRHRENSAAWVCGKTDKDDRRKMLTDFAAGRIQYMVNVGCLTEGFDDAGVEVVIMGRPTKSRCLYAQMVGRAIRPAEAIAHTLNDEDHAEARREAIRMSVKPSCLVVDFVGNSGKHKLCTSADILGGNVSDEAIALAVRRAKDTGAPVDMAKELSAAQQEVERQRQAEAARRAKLTASATFRARSVNPFDVLDIAPSVERGWEKGKRLSDKQRDLLAKQGMDPDALTYGQGKQVLNELFRRWDGGLATFGQMKHLRKSGILAPVRKEEASRMLNKLWGKTA